MIQNTAHLLGYVGTAFRDKYARTNLIEDLGRAVQSFKKAFNIIPDGHQGQTATLENLGAIYGDKYQATGEPEYRETTMKHVQRAINITPEGHPSQAGQLVSLGIAYKERYQKNKNKEDLERAIQHFQKGLDKTPDNHPARAHRLVSLGITYKERYQKNNDKEDLERAIQYLQKSLKHSPSPIPNRLNSIRDLIRLHMETRNFSLAYQDANICLALIPLLTLRSLQNSDKQHLLTQIVGVASDATAAALMVGKTPYDAIQLLELGRGVIIGSLAEIRTDISDLQRDCPQLAEDFITFRNQLEAPVASIIQDNPRYTAGQKLEQTIQAIRKQPGFDRFLLASSEDELTAAASFGVIVMINVSDYGCDALIIEKSKLRTCPLPQLQSSHVRAYKKKKEMRSLEVLKWLWESTAKPVLDELGYTSIPLNDCWPRIWWIPTGSLTGFPIHAAGDHFHGSSNTVLDCVISSYSSSVKALIHSRQRCLQVKPEQASDKAVLIGMPSLYYAPQEILKLEDICRSMQLQVIKPQPGQRDVLSALSDCKIFHFAGHGKTNLLDPSKSSLILSDGDLEVASLFEKDLGGLTPFLAYLSACGTGAVNHDGLIEEGLHLIAACQLAGFQHVVGTLWEVEDKFCVAAATKTYEWMKRRGVSSESVSEGLHDTIRSLRYQWVSEITERGEIEHGTKVNEEGCELAKVRELRTVNLCNPVQLDWVPFVHFGV